MSQKQKVAYFYDPEIGQFYYGQGHPMKPHRVRMAHSLILHAGLYSQMDAFRPRPADAADLAAFHAEDYVQFLATVTPERTDALSADLARFNMLEDCPAFPGLWRYCQLYAGGSVGGAARLNHCAADVAINWAGGLHHGKKAEASGFCYVNDIVLAVLELLKYHQRVLYVDIDVHHGDGVEEAFLTTDRVMTVSFHKFGGGFFPGTGDSANMGAGRGRGYALNVPLRDGVGDDAYQSVFQPVMARVMEVYRPEAVVLQCGSDSLAGDRLGVFNLSSHGHAACVAYMRAFGLPLLLLGGGGYTLVNVARCWALEAGVALGAPMDDALPPNEYYEYYAPAYELPVRARPGVEDKNSREYLDVLRERAFDQLAAVAPAPSVQFHERAPDGMSAERLGDEGGEWEDGAAAMEAGGGAAEEEGDGEGGRAGGRARLWDGEEGEERGGGGGGAAAAAAGHPASPQMLRVPRPAMLRPADGSGEAGEGSAPPGEGSAPPGLTLTTGGETE